MLLVTLVTLVARYVDLSSDFGGEEALSATAALEQITREEARFDPRLLKVFIRMMGPFPIGSTVQLSTGEIAVVFRQATEPRLCRRPLVKVVRDRTGLVVGPIVVDLTAADENGSFYAGIVRPVPTSLVEGLDAAKVVFAATEEQDEEDPGEPSHPAGP